MRKLSFVVVISALISLSGCISPPPAHDYSAFRNANPSSILVLPPINQSQEVVAPYSVVAQLVNPIAESGYYMFPAALVEQTFRNNGMSVAEDIHVLPTEKLREIFVADAALYLTIEEYGTSYVIISSDTVVTISAKLIDLRTGQLLWEDKASASSAETRGNSGGGLVGMLVEAAVNQIIETVTDRGFGIAKISSSRLLSADLYNGLLHGPRSKKHGQPAISEQKN